MIAPRPDLTRAHPFWPELTLYAATVYLEAGGEPDAGKLAVAWVIKNRMVRRDQSIATVILAPAQFSCWTIPASAEARLARLDTVAWDRCWWAMAAAYWAFLPDPTQGAGYYLNEIVTREGREHHDLPAWFSEDRVTVRIAQHTFLRLG